MNIEQAREIAAQCWCDDRNGNAVMDGGLAESFAERLVKHTNRIPAATRVKLATRTEAPVTPEMIARLSTPRTIRLLHVGIGMATEAGEYLDQMKKHIFYGKELDETNLMEELGDADWYINLCCSVLNTTMKAIEEANIKKLAARYGDRFSEDAALIRNLGVELDVLKENLKQ